MATLTEQQKKQLVLKEPTVGIDKLMGYIQKYENLSLDDFPNMDSTKKQAILQRLNSLPNPSEQQEWNNIAPMIGTPATTELQSALQTYIQNWGSVRPAGNHVDQASIELNRVNAELNQAKLQFEQNDWNNVDHMDIDSLANYLQKYPDTVHRSEIDDEIWSLVGKENIPEIQRYLTLFGTGNHVAEANNILNSIVSWNDVKSTNDIFEISKYINENPQSPFLEQAKFLVMQLKQQEFAKMRDNPNAYDVSRLLNLVDNGILTEQELVNAKALTSRVLNRLKCPPQLPDVDTAIEASKVKKENGIVINTGCQGEGVTDVFFFGVPATGKTCVLMGLSRSASLDMNTAGSGGMYAQTLQDYTDYGKIFPHTNGSTVIAMESDIYANNAKHKINLVEMAGEDFLFDIAYNPKSEVKFEQMGIGATELLKNNNRKVFFLIIDPTVTMIHGQREHVYGIDQNGDPLIETQTCTASQRAIVNKMVHLLTIPDNRKIMEKVDSIHFIMTKSDVLGDSIEKRNEEALKIFNQTYEQDVLRPLIDLCKECNINISTGHHPKLYTFSLGTFYVGGLYEYDPTDSARLVTAIKNATIGTKDKTFWDKVKEKVN